MRSDSDTFQGVVTSPEDSIRTSGCVFEDTYNDESLKAKKRKEDE